MNGNTFVSDVEMMPNVPNSSGSDLQRQHICEWNKVIALGYAGVPKEARAVDLFCAPESDHITEQLIVCSGGLVP